MKVVKLMMAVVTILSIIVVRTTTK